MAAREVRIWLDDEGDYLEVIFDQKIGYFRETTDDRVMIKVDAESDILGFAILNPRAPQRAPLDVLLLLAADD